MRKFDYRNDYNLINNGIRGYLIQLEKELELLIKLEKNNIVYVEAYKKVLEFKNKYQDLNAIYKQILSDLLSSDNALYAYHNGKYKIDASKKGVEFEEDLKEIFRLEEKLRDYSVQVWNRDLTSFEDIENGKDFIIVVHASYLLPGTKDDTNYKDNKYSTQYLSGSVFSSNEMNTFNDIRTLYILDVDDSNYIASSEVDSVTRDGSTESFYTLKEIDINGDKHYINVGYSNDRNKSVTMISTPRLIEGLSIKRELSTSNELYRYNSLTNEVVLDRTKTKVKGVILLSNGCDILLSEYLYLKQLGIKFKCINKGLYREKNNILPYTNDEYDDFLIQLDNIDEIITRYNISEELLQEYYNEVILPMQYDEVIMKELNKKFSKYLPNISSNIK